MQSNIFGFIRLNKRQLLEFLLLIFMLTTLSGCVTSSAISDESSTFDTESGNSNISESESASTSNTTTDIIPLAPAELEAPGQFIQEDTSSIYICSDNCLQKYNKQDYSDSTLLYQASSDVSLLSYCLFQNTVYILTQSHVTDGTTQTKLLLLQGTSKPVAILDFTDQSYSQVQIYNNVLYLSSYDTILAYDLQDDGSLGSQNTDYASIINTIESGDTTSPLTSYNAHSAYYDIPYCIAIYGKIFLLNSDGQLLEADPSDTTSLSNPTILTQSIPGSIVGMTSQYIVSIDSYSDGSGAWTCYTTDLSSGETNAFAMLDDINASSAVDQVLGIDEAGIYLGLTDTSSNTSTPQSIYQVKYITFQGAAQTNLFSLKPEASLSITSGAFSSGSYRFLEDGFYYVRSKDYKNLAFIRDYHDMTKETMMGESAFYDSGLEESGISLVQQEYTKYANNDSAGKSIIHIKTMIPVFDSSVYASTTINSIFSSAAETNENEYLNQAMGDYTSYLDTLTEDETIESDLSYSGGFPYEYDYLMTGVTYQDSNYINIGMSEYTYTGGAHGSSWDTYYLLDKKTGEQLSLDDVLSMPKEDFSALVIQYLQTEIDTDPSMYFEDAASSVQTYYAQNDYNYLFYLTSDGIAVEFGQYEIAPYAAGISHIIIPYSDVSLSISLS